MNLKEFDFTLPNNLIAKYPIKDRTQSKLLIINKNIYKDTQFFYLIDHINKDDLIIFNNSKVLKARLFGNKTSGAKIEILVEKITNNNTAVCCIKSNKSIKTGNDLLLKDNVQATIIDSVDSLFTLRFEFNKRFFNLIEYLDNCGHMPLPPYVKRIDEAIDEERYQTVYANCLGSIAAPTAGLHFDNTLIQKLIFKGVRTASVTLHVGLGTFKPVLCNNIHDHKMHSEYYEMSNDVVDMINYTKQIGANVIAVGTTSLRVLETVANNNFNILSGETNLFITPGYEFKIVDKLITNFHLPKSTLLMLVSAFTDVNTIKNAYKHAIDNHYRFYSYGDAMLLTCNKNK